MTQESASSHEIRVQERRQVMIKEDSHPHAIAPTAMTVNRTPINSEERENGVQRYRFTPQQLRDAMDASDEADEANGGILASGLAWVQKKREERRKKHLQQQAELQLKKIYEAEREKLGDKSEQQFARANELTKSGEGASGQLDMTNFDSEEYLPEVRIEEEKGNVRPFILSQDQMQQVAIHVLPQTVAFGRWKRLYDIGRDGDSFDACLRVIQKTERTLMVVRTTKGAVFGGYAESAWNTNKSGSVNFYGGAQACLFSLIPGTDQLNVYKWTGKNRYIQLCDVSHKMFAFGGGGDDGMFGLAVEEDFQRGSTGPCDTFDNAFLMFSCSISLIL